MFKGIIFDLDGTLVDSLSLTFEAFHLGIASQGVRPHSREEIMRHFGTGEDEILKKIVGPEKAEKAYQAVCDYLNSNIAKVPLHSGIADLLETLKSQSIPLSIFTGRSWETTQIILKHHQLLDRFVSVIANDHVESPKPSPEGLHQALTQMKLFPKDVIFVGDSDLDILAAHRAGIFSVAAIWDLLAHRENLARHTPDYWATHPSELLPLVS